MRKFLNNPKFAIVLALIAATAVARAVIAGLPDRDDPLPVAAAPDAPAAPLETISASLAASATTVLAKALAASASAVPEDPFAHESAAEASAAVKVTLRVSALWQEGLETLAVVNGRIVRPGDEISGVRIGPGEAGGLTLVRRGVRQVVPVGGEWTGR